MRTTPALFALLLGCAPAAVPLSQEPPPADMRATSAPQPSDDMPTPKRFVEHCDLAICYHFDRLQNTYCVRGPWGPNTDPVRYCVPLPMIA